jgi:hypothetical protein
MKRGSLSTISLVCLRTLKCTKFDSFGWVMVEFMYAQVTNKILGIVSASNYVVLICDEVNTFDNKSWISIHIYVM